MAFTSRTREEGETYRPTEALECTIERVTYHNEENGYAVLKVLPMDARDKVKADVIAVLGSFSNPVVGESLRIFGWWDKHPQHGKQFKAVRYEVIRPATAAAIEKYLGSGMIKGIGPKAAEWMVKKFGVKTLEVIEHHPDKLQEVKGIGEKKALMIQAGFIAQKEIAAIMEFLIGHGITPTYAVKIYKYYKERAIEQVEKNPYQLATDIWGIGFRSADKIALNLGVTYDAPQRLEAGLVYVLNSEMESGGHCYLPQNELVSKAAENLYIKSADDLPEHDQAHEKAQLGQKLEPVLADLIARGLLVAETIELMGHEEVAIYTPSFHTTEKAVADRVHQLLNSPWRNRPKPAEIDKIVESLPGHETLSEEQDMAVRRALSESVLVLTGGPGCGKTFTTNFIVQALEKLGRRIQIAAPTGRAAKRAAEVSGREAKTIHRLLVFDPEKKGFKHGPGEPLELDVLVIDESSMLDLMLTHNTIRAIPDGAQIIFVGDVDQLPSVGAGNVLNDLIQSGRVPVVRLTQVFRQAAASKIITNAHAINKGKMPTLLPPSEAKNGADCVFIEVDETEDLLQKIKGIVAKSLPNLGFKPEEITVLSPMQRGMVGVRNLNEELQKIVNPPHASKNEHPRGGIILRVGDRVMQRRNNYDKNVFNGDVGYIGSIESEEQMLVVDYPEGPVEYEFAETDELNHAFSLTTHKCLHPDERIRTQRGLIPISEVQAGDRVQTGFGQKRRVMECFDTNERPIVVLKTRSGQTLKVSPEHPLWTVPSSESTPLWRIAGELEVGDILALDRTVWESAKEPELPEVVPLVGRPNAELPHVPSYMNPTLAYLLGLIVGDGSYRDQKDGTVDLTSMDAEIQEAYEKTLTGYGLRVCRYAPAGKRAIRLYIVSRAFRAWLVELGLGYASARGKHVPEIVFRASVKSRAAFLRGLFDTDGSAGKEGSSNRSVRFVTASDGLADDVQQLLLSLGIVSNRRHSAVAVMLEVSGPSLPVFAERIGFGLGYKQERLERLVASQGEVGKTNRDTIPFGASLAEEFWGVLKKRNCPEVARLRSILSRIRHGILQMSYRHLAECVVYLEREGLPISSRACQALRLHHYFDPLVSVEKTSEVAAMIDIEVEGIHSFVAGSGMICHNSQGSEYPACVIIVHNTHYMMLQRNLVYTALTRAKKFAVIIGTQWALKRSVSNKHVQPRYTRLAQRLQNLVEGIGTSGLPGAAKTGRETRELPTPPMPGRLF